MSHLHRGQKAHLAACGAFRGINNDSPAGKRIKVIFPAIPTSVNNE